MIFVSTSLSSDQQFSSITSLSFPNVEGAYHHEMDYGGSLSLVIERHFRNLILIQVHSCQLDPFTG